MNRPAPVTAPPEAHKPKANDLPDTMVLAEYLPYRFAVTAMAMSKLYAETYETRFGLSLQEWRIMATLGECESMTTQEVIAKSEMDRVKVSRAVIRLDDKGLLSRRAVENDMRAQVLRLTEKGMKLYKQIVPMSWSLERQIYETLSEDERKTLRKILEKLYGRSKDLARQMQR